MVLVVQGELCNTVFLFPTGRLSKMNVRSFNDFQLIHITCIVYDIKQSEEGGKRSAI